MSNSIDFNKINVDSYEDTLRKIFKTEVLVNQFRENISVYAKFLENKNLKKLFDSTEMQDTILVLFENNLNLSIASKKAFMHRNTVIYRANKIKKLTGLNVKNFEDAVILKNMLMVYNNIMK